MADGSSRMANRPLIEEAMVAWTAERTLEEALAQFEAADAAAAEVYDMAALAADPHAVERGIFVEAEGFRMQGLAARLSAPSSRMVVLPVGDHLLQELASRMKHVVRGRDLVARMGGDDAGAVVIRIIEGDCVEIMRTLPEASVDAIVTDPPASAAFGGIGGVGEGNRGAAALAKPSVRSRCRGRL